MTQTISRPSWKLSGANIEIPAADLGDRQRWLDARRTGVTATDVRVLAGHGYANETVFGKWLDKVEPTPEDEGDDTPLAWELGHDFEPIIRKHAQRRVGAEFRSVGLLRSKEARHLLASPDWNTADGGLGEGKSTASWYLRDHFDISDPYTNRDGWTLPAAWRVQALHQLTVSARSHVHVAALLVDRRTFTFWTVEPDAAEQAVLRGKADAFWALVEAGTPPEVDFEAISDREVRQRWPQAVEGRIVADNPDEVVRLIRDRATFKTEAGDYKEHLERIELRLKAIAGDATEVTDRDGNVLFRWSNSARKSYDIDRLLADHPEIDADSYRNETRFRTLGGFLKLGR